MTLITLTDTTQLPRGPLHGYVACTPDEACMIYRRHHGAAPATVYQIEHIVGGVSIWIPLPGGSQHDGTGNDQ